MPVEQKNNEQNAVKYGHGYDIGVGYGEEAAEEKAHEFTGIAGREFNQNNPESHSGSPENPDGSIGGVIPGAAVPFRLERESSHEQGCQKGKADRAGQHGQLEIKSDAYAPISGVRGSSRKKSHAVLHRERTDYAAGHACQQTGKHGVIHERIGDNSGKKIF